MPRTHPKSDTLLTKQQRRVLYLVAVGCTDKTIAARLGISERTARFHVAGAMSRLGADSGSHAVALAIRRGEISPRLRGKLVSSWS